MQKCTYNYCKRDPYYEWSLDHPCPYYLKCDIKRQQLKDKLDALIGNIEYKPL